MELQAAYFPGRATAPRFSDEAPYADCVITDEHAACSYGQPVVLLDGTPHGPADLDGVVVARSEIEGAADIIARVAAAGYRFEAWQ